MQSTIATEIKTLKESILEAVRQGNHTLKEISEFAGKEQNETLFEIEILENIELFRIDPPAAPFISWWTKKPKGRIVREWNGKLVELPVEAKNQIEIPVRINVKASHDYAPIEQVVEVPVTAFIRNDNNPRHAVNKQEQSFLDLVESVREKGIQQPVIATPDPSGKLRLVIGERRWTAAGVVGLEKIPCVIRKYNGVDEEEEVMLIENIQRQDLTPMQQAKAFYRLYVKSNRDFFAVARKVGLTDTYIKQKMQLLKLDPEIQKMVDERKVGFGQALQLTRLEPKKQLKLVPRAVQMKAKDLKVLVDREKSGAVPPSKWKAEKRVTTDEEAFTRSWALKELKKKGETYYTAQYLKDALDDVCQDACVESKNEALCHNCPIPRFFAAIMRHHTRGENNA